MSVGQNKLCILKKWQKNNYTVITASDNTELEKLSIFSVP